ncbi:TPA: transcriptional regulator [Patescibacteria group bacterium]|uniref:Helix-turn-helix domain protein n=1 Tax=Candidatus Gottesmanbacteria bacterium GW2011_GWA1_43_11 TaxID=1618436 RepID=A0A0G1F9H8_9BACT|nr:MAG: Helix-turn-helix domain protein [Candidatus Gottesmanbacteria bacterium GW2011_GWA1_43_11]HCS79276.1 transcriptional regulator [Patescibacteria group bacterium]
MKTLIPFEVHKKKLLSDPEVKKAYDELETEYAIIHAVLQKRLAKKMSQQELAKKVGTKQSAISRLESGNANPSLRFLQKIARALETKLTISLQ